MQYKTSSSHFEKYGFVYDHPMEFEQADLLRHEAEITASETISSFYQCNCEVHIEIKSGMAALIVGETLETAAFEAFAVHRNITLRPNVYFQITAISSAVSYDLITENGCCLSLQDVTPAYHFNRILPKVRVSEILGYYYSIRDSGYVFEGEAHPYYELTYVDRGTLVTEIDGTEFELKERDLIIYGPEQHHSQRIRKGCSCSYVTILFELEPEAQRFDYLLNKIFPYNKKIHSLLKTLVNESSSLTPYMDSLLLCLFQEIIIRLLQSEYEPPEHEKQPISEVRQYQHNELLEQILEYIDQTLCEPITIGEICDKFSISRSTLQMLFNENLHQAPKKYISELKLEKSRQLISEDRYTISEIALTLGFSSIHYFSRAFTLKYNMSPTDYAKTLFKS